MSEPGQPSPVADNELGVCDVRRQEVAGVAQHRFIGHAWERLAAVYHVALYVPGVTRFVACCLTTRRIHIQIHSFKTPDGVCL